MEKLERRYEYRHHIAAIRARICARVSTSDSCRGFFPTSSYNVARLSWQSFDADRTFPADNRVRIRLWKTSNCPSTSFNSNECLRRRGRVHDDESSLMTSKIFRCSDPSLGTVTPYIGPRCIGYGRSSSGRGFCFFLGEAEHYYLIRIKLCLPPNTGAARRHDKTW